MNIEQFAKKAGIVLTTCDPKDWGGSIGYQSTDYPHSTTCGFRTPAAAYKHWLAYTFGERTSKTVLALLKASQS